MSQAIIKPAKYPESGKVVVVGPPRAGTRLLARIIDESPDLEAYHDSSHGVRLRNRDARGVVLVTREIAAIEASIKNPSDKKNITWWQDPIECLKNIYDKYDLDCIVSYEDIVANVDEVIGVLANRYGVDPWPCSIEIYDGNARHYGESNE